MTQTKKAIDLQVGDICAQTGRMVKGTRTLWGKIIIRWSDEVTATYHPNDWFRIDRPDAETLRIERNLTKLLALLDNGE